MQDRDIKFDVLKAMGLLGIILAHVNPPTVLYQLRNFDVGLMVIASGALLSYTNPKKQPSYFNYLKKRIPRLIAPTWLFLAFYFAIFSLLGENFTQKVIIGSFGLTVGYVWIIRIFLIIAIFAPLILKINRILTKTQFLAVLLGAYFFQEITLGAIKQIPYFTYFINTYIVYIIPYCFFLGIGIILTKLSKKEIIAISIISLVVFVATGIYLYLTLGEIKASHSYKYPPQLYYVSFALGVSLLLYYVVDKFSERIAGNKALSKFFIFTGGNTLWIYLWHTFVLNCLKLARINLNFVVAFFVVVSSAIAITHIQRKIVGLSIKNLDITPGQTELLNVLFLK
jgi:fucose 4-O-acetylase-like acetyltransferase